MSVGREDEQSEEREAERWLQKPACEVCGVVADDDDVTGNAELAAVGIIWLWQPINSSIWTHRSWHSSIAKSVSSRRSLEEDILKFLLEAN